MSAGYRIERLRLPPSLAGPGAEEFLEFSRLTDAVQRQIWGHEDRCSPPEYRLRVWRDSPYDETVLFFARAGGRMAGRAWCRVSLKEDLDRARVRAEVLDEFSRRGLGRALLEAALEEARRRGRTVVDAFTEHPVPGRPNGSGPNGSARTGPGEPTAGAEAVVPSTGTGTLPAGERPVRFARAAGFSLNQVVRFSELDLAEHDGGWPALAAAASAKASAEYELMTWEGVPPEHRAGMAQLFARMSVDAPQGESRTDAAVWDAERVAALDRMLAEAGTVPLYAAARHRATGLFAAYTSLWVRRGKETVADQDDTLVASGHRGRSLGMWVKLANLAQYRAKYPAARKVVTFNAEENAHMLDINEAIGFRPAGHDGEWYRSLP
ncbi:GNAT family N-acetyltransferase [Sinomonas soli]